MSKILKISLFLMISTIIGYFSFPYAYKQWLICQYQEDDGFIYTYQEKSEKIKWKYKSMDDLNNDAKSGDSAALFNLGSYFLLGIDFPIDIELADHLFSKSASLGFAPSLYQVSKMYLHDKKNTFLFMVYLNLTIAFGHTELTEKYHELRQKCLNDFGPKMTEEIENLACKKMMIILDNQKNYKNSLDKKKWFQSMPNVVTEDIQYESAYWEQFFINPKKKISNQPWYLHIDSLDFNSETKEFLTLIADGFFKIPEALSPYISEDDIRKYLENNVPMLMETRDGQYQIVNTLKKLSEIGDIEHEAMESIIDEHYGVVPENIEDLVNERVGFKVKKIINAFKANIKY